jgi:NAD-dependent DNA ligase
LKGTIKDLEDAIGSAIDPSKISEELREKIKEMKDTKKPTLLQTIQTIEAERMKLEDQLRQEREQAARRVQELKAAKQAEETKVKEKQTAIDQRDEQIAKLQLQMKQMSERLEKRADDLAAQLEAERKKAQAKIDEQGNKIIDLENLIRDLRDIIARLSAQATLETTATEFKPETDPADGEVILVDEDTGIVVDIGRKDGVRRGLRFAIYTPKADGTRVKQGELEIKTVFPEISRGILVGGENPVGIVHKNDIIVNPAFHPGRAQTFVADTVFDDAKKEVFREALKEYGSRLEEEVTPRTNYLIIGAQPGDLREAAKRFGVPMIREQDLNAFLGRR